MTTDDLELRIETTFWDRTRIAIAPTVFTASSFGVAYGMGALTNDIVNISPVIAAAVGSYILDYSSFWLSNSFFHKDTEMPTSERRAVRAVIGAALAFEATAMIAATSIADFSEKQQTYPDSFVHTAVLGIGTYVLGRYAIPALWKETKNIVAKPFSLRKLFLPAVVACSVGYVGFQKSQDTHAAEEIHAAVQVKPAAIAKPMIVRQETQLTQIEDAIYTSLPPFETWPVAVPVDKRTVSSCFGWRGKHTAGGQGTEYHSAIDITDAPRGTPVLAIGNGVVTDIETSYNTIWVDHGNGIRSSYLHLDTFTAKVGDKVLAGNQLGTVGGKGPKGPNQFRPHLHLQIEDNTLPHKIQTEEGMAVLSEHLNPIYYMSSLLDYRVIQTRGCKAQGGADKFKLDYEALDNPDRVRKFHSHTLLGIRQRYGLIIDSAAEEESLEPAVLYALMATESGGNKNAVSSSGASGPMQFIESTAYQYGLCDNKKCKGRDDRNNPEKAIPAAAQLYSRLIDHYKGYTAQVELAAAAYNAGTNLVDEAITRTSLQNPLWENVSAVITPQFVREVAPHVWFRDGMTPERKAVEIRSHVLHFKSYEEQYTTFPAQTGL